MKKPISEMELAADKKIEIILIAGIAILTVILVVGGFAYRNYDILNENFPEVKGYKFGFTEDIVKLKDGTEIYYLT